MNPFQADNAANPATFKAAGGPPVGASNFFVSEFSSSGSLLYSTYVGGGGVELKVAPLAPIVELGDAGTGIKVDGSNNVWVTGAVTSRSSVAPDVPFPATNATTGCFQDDNSFTSGFGQGPLATVVVFNLDGTTIPFLTFLPGDYLDIPLALAVDGTNHPYVTGFTYSAAYPTTIAPGNAAFQSVNNAFGNGKGPILIFGPGFGTTNAFITELDPTSADCSDLLYPPGTQVRVAPPASNSMTPWSPNKGSAGGAGD